jgi:iron complex transport system ATP-binding protein
MEKMNITHLKHRTFTQLSGGEQQLVIIARALAQQPNFLIMDEPAASLDFGNQVKLIKQINLLHQDNLGILMATHSPDHAFMCDAYVALVQHGTLLNLGHCNDGITENVLEKLYDVNIKILQLEDNKHDRKYCVPVIA